MDDNKKDDDDEDDSKVEFFLRVRKHKKNKFFSLFYRKNE